MTGRRSRYTNSDTTTKTTKWIMLKLRLKFHANIYVNYGMSLMGTLKIRLWKYETGKFGAKCGIRQQGWNMQERRSSNFSRYITVVGIALTLIGAVSAGYRIMAIQSGFDSNRHHHHHHHRHHHQTSSSHSMPGAVVWQSHRCGTVWPLTLLQSLCKRDCGAGKRCPIGLTTINMLLSLLMDYTLRVIYDLSFYWHLVIRFFFIRHINNMLLLTPVNAAW